MQSNRQWRQRTRLERQEQATIKQNKEREKGGQLKQELQSERRQHTTQKVLRANVSVNSAKLGHNGANTNVIMLGTNGAINEVKRGWQLILEAKHEARGGLGVSGRPEAMCTRSCSPNRRQHTVQRLRRCVLERDNSYLPKLRLSTNAKTKELTMKIQCVK